MSYSTTSAKFNKRSEDICGRATRVWEAYREDDLDRVSVIKDLWVPYKRGTNCWSSMTACAHSPTLARLVRPHIVYFLTILDHGFVRTWDGSDDYIRDVIMRGYALPTTTNHDRH
ncbi:hypothetical protein C8J57DRAFT_1491696 [Mycena rebaudengoi]|nr:hypothetical protein C8J57DRAFT_1491696 [Mycena rebaudengoi]